MFMRQHLLLEYGQIVDRGKVRQVLYFALVDEVISDSFCLFTILYVMHIETTFLISEIQKPYILQVHRVIRFVQWKHMTGDVIGGFR